MEKYFFNVENLEQLRCQYRKLLKKYHPDNAGGSEEITKAINSEYEKIFRMLKQGHDSATSDNKKSGHSPDRADMYDWENDRTLRQVLYKIMNFEGIEIEMVGQWMTSEIITEARGFIEKIMSIGLRNRFNLIIGYRNQQCILAHSGELGSPEWAVSL